MTDFSMNLVKLEQMAGKLDETARKFTGTVSPAIARLEIPGDAFPVFDAGASGAYQIMQTAAGDASAATAAALNDAGAALRNVVTHYRAMEEKHGRSFDTGLRD